MADMRIPSVGPDELVDTSEFERMNEEMKQRDDVRDEVIRRSRDINKLSKQAIFSMHRNDLRKAKKQLEDAEKVLRQRHAAVARNDARGPRRWHARCFRWCASTICGSAPSLHLWRSMWVCVFATRAHVHTPP